MLKIARRFDLMDARASRSAATGRALKKCSNGRSSAAAMRPSSVEPTLRRPVSIFDRAVLSSEALVASSAWERPLDRLPSPILRPTAASEVAALFTGIVRF